MEAKQDKIIKILSVFTAVCLMAVMVITVSLSSNNKNKKEESGSESSAEEYISDEQKTYEALIDFGEHLYVGMPQFHEIDRYGEQNTTEAGTLTGADDLEVAATVGETETEPEPEPETEPVSPFKNMFMTDITEKLNVRKEPNTDSEIVGRLYPGAGGYIVEKGEEWSLVNSGNVTGYVFNKYLVFDEKAEEYAWDNGNVTAKSTVNSLRIREGFSTDYKVIGVINEGTEVKVLEKGDEGWSQVKYGNVTGYICNDYLVFSVTIDYAMTMEEEAAYIAAEEARKKAEAEEAARKKAAEEAALKKAVANSKFVETVKTSPYNVTEEDAYLLACVVCAEAGSEIYEGKLAVANVILNRLRGGAYGKTVKDVVYAPNQFSVVGSCLNKVIKNGPNSESIRAAKEALSGVNNVPNYANFCAKYVANYSKYTEYTIIGSQVFYRR